MSSRSISALTLTAVGLALLVPSLATAATPLSSGAVVTPGASERVAAATTAGRARQAVNVLVAPLPGMDLAGGRVTILNGDGTKIGSATTNHLSTTQVQIAGPGGSGPFTVSVNGGTLRYAVNGEWITRPFTGELHARTSRIDAAAPVVIVDVASTSALALTEQARLTYPQALDAAQDALGIPVKAPAYTTAFLNWDVSGAKLLRVADRRGGYDELITAIVDAAARGDRLAGDLEPQRGRGAAQLDAPPSKAARTQGSPAAMQVRNTSVVNSCVGGTAGAGTANGTPPSGAGYDLGTVRGFGGYSPNYIRNMATDALGGLIKFTAGGGEGAAPLIMGALFGLGKSAERQMLDTVIDNQQVMGRQLERILQNQQAIATQLNCITTQVGQLSSNLSIAVSTESSRTCVAQIDTGWNLYQFLVRNASKDEPLDMTNPAVKLAATTWQSQISHCSALIDTMLFGRNAQDTGEGTWAKVLQRYADTANREQSGTFTPPQVQELQAYLAYWGALQYRALVLVSEAHSVLDLPQITLALIGADRNGQCPTATASATYCRFTANMQQATPSDLLSNELGYVTCPDAGSAGRGCAVSALPGGLGIVPYHQGGTIPTAERALALNDRDLNRACIRSRPSNRPNFGNSSRVNWEYKVQFNCTDSRELHGSVQLAPFGVFGPTFSDVDWTQWHALQTFQEPPIGPQINPSQSFAENAIRSTNMRVEQGSATALPPTVATWKYPKEPRAAMPPSSYNSTVFGDFASTFFGGAFKSGGAELPTRMQYLPATPIMVVPAGLYGGINSASPTWSSVGGSRVYPIDCLRGTLQHASEPCRNVDEFFNAVTREAGNPFFAMEGIPAATPTTLPIRHRPKPPYVGVPVVNCPGSTCPAGRTYSFLVHGAWKAPLPVVNTVTDAWTPPSATAPVAPEKPSLTASTGRIDVEWAPPWSNGRSRITGYTATTTSGASCTTTSAATTKCSIVGLDNNTTHSVTVTAKNAVGTSSPSAPSTVAMPTPPSAPDAPLLTAFLGRIDVAWAEPEADGGAAITGYTATALPGGATCTTRTDNECTITNLEENTTYTVTVAAFNAVGTGPDSEASTAITPSAPITLLKPDAGSFGSGVALVPQAVTPAGAVSPSGALTITGFNLTPRTLVPGIGSNITYSLNMPATVTITFTHSRDRARSSRVVYRMAEGRPGAVAGATRIRLLYDDASAARKRAGIWKVRIEAQTASGMVASRTISVSVRATTS